VLETVLVPMRPALLPETESPSSGSGEMEPAPLGSGETEFRPLWSNETESVPFGSDKAGLPSRGRARQ
jgi:hypothetical protein